MQNTFKFLVLSMSFKLPKYDKNCILNLIILSFITTV